MKQKLPLPTRIARILFNLAILLQFLFIALELLGISQGANNTDTRSSYQMLGRFLNLFTVEVSMGWGGGLLIPVLFKSLFVNQARGNTSGILSRIVWLCIVMVIDHWSAIQMVKKGERLSTWDIAYLTINIVILFIYVALLTGSRVLAILCAVGMVPYTLLSLWWYAATPFLPTQALMALLATEFITDLGIFIGLFGVKTVAKQKES